jgi:hypothetical protein
MLPEWQPLDLTSLHSQFTTNPNNYTFAYYTGGSPITNPTNFQYSADTNVSVVIKDPFTGSLR